MTDVQKKETISLFMDMFDVSGIKLADLVENRIALINDNLMLENTKEKEISLQYTLTRIYKSKYYVYDILGNETKKGECATAYESAKTKLNQMI